MEIDILQKVSDFGQQHLIEHLKQIESQEKKDKYLKQLNSIDFEQTKQLFQNVYLESKNIKEIENIKFSPIQNVETVESIKKNQSQFKQLGYNSIAKGEVGVCIMSGGQGTRLGFDHPKGMFNLGLKCNLTLFGFFAHRLLRLMQLIQQEYKDSAKKGKGMIKWYLMTSEMNHEQIVSYFKNNNYFGYDESSIIFFPQGGIPALSYQGKVIIEDEGVVSLAPGGNGAIYTQMKQKGIIKHMRDNGVKYIYIGPVDNVLLKLADPICLGYLIKNNFQIVSTYIKKRSADEKVGLHVNANGRIQICEYSQAPQNVKQLKNQQGQYVYAHGSRATMYVTTDFIDRITTNPITINKINKKYHLAQKKIKYYDTKTKQVIKPEKNNGVKFQLFYFDVFQETNNFGLFQTLRADQFAPLKNATGEDSPESAKKLLSVLHRKWIERNGITVQGEGQLQISPLVSYDGQGLKEFVVKQLGSQNLKLPIYLS